MPIVTELEREHPQVEVLIHEYEPARHSPCSSTTTSISRSRTTTTWPRDLPIPCSTLAPLWSTPWGLGVPAAEAPPDDAADLSSWADRPWIVNSRNTADEDAVRTLGSLAGFTPWIRHHIDSLDLVEDLIRAGHGVGLLPVQRPTTPEVRVLALTDPAVILTAYAVTRRGREDWSPLRLVLDRLGETAGIADPYAPEAATG